MAMTPRQRTAAYRQRLAERQLVRVSVVVPLADTRAVKAFAEARRQPKAKTWPNEATEIRRQRMAAGNVSAAIVSET